MISHIAPGYFEKYEGLMWFYPEFNDRYVKLLRQHIDVIGSQMYGHEHTDSFRIVHEQGCFSYYLPLHDNFTFKQMVIFNIQISEYEY